MKNTVNIRVYETTRKRLKLRAVKEDKDMITLIDELSKQ